MSLLSEHITEFVGSFDPTDESAAEAFKAAVEDHFTQPPAPDGPLHHSIVRVDVLWNSDEYHDPAWTDLLALAAAGLDGGASITVEEASRVTVTRSRMADLLLDQGSDPEFHGPVCRFPCCDDDPDDGNGWDGWCGHHADTIEAHRGTDHGHDPVERTDCAVCAGHAPMPDGD